MPTTRPLRILVVDDDPAMVGAITALVGTEGHQVITAYDGLTAVKRFRDDTPDLVVLDLAMPGPDGFNVTGQIRAAGNVPILVVSGESGEGAKVKALEIGADDYLTKPFGKAELLARISAIMRRADAATSSTGVAGGGPLEAGPLDDRPGPPRGADRADHPQPDRHRVPAPRGARPGAAGMSSPTTGSSEPGGQPSPTPTCSGSSPTSPDFGRRFTRPAGRPSWRSARSATGSRPNGSDL